MLGHDQMFRFAHSSGPGTSGPFSDFLFFKKNENLSNLILSDLGTMKFRCYASRAFKCTWTQQNWKVPMKVKCLENLETWKVPFWLLSGLGSFINRSSLTRVFKWSKNPQKWWSLVRVWAKINSGLKNLNYPGITGWSVHQGSNFTFIRK